MIDVPMPGAAPAQLLVDEQPSKQREPGPAVLGRDVEVHQADLVRLRDDSAGWVMCSSYSAAFGRISFSANSCASSRSARCSSVSANDSARADGVLGDGHRLVPSCSID